jgi:hypothetical protein
VDHSEEPGVCGGEPPAIMPHGPDGDGREGWITGTRLYAKDVAAALERSGSEAAVARELGLSGHQVRVALAYWERNVTTW